MAAPFPDAVGLVILGRNEASLLRESLSSLPSGAAHLVYVDSASTDASAHLARELGAEVIELDQSSPLCAARARRAGFDRLLELSPHLSFVQFIDADCVLCDSWLATATAAMLRDAKMGAVWGWRRERHPDASIYNRTCDLEWLVPPANETSHFGGDVLVRVEAYRAAGGYDAAMIAAEDHELSARFRKAGWHIRRIDAPMTIHDSRMTSLWQWWRRAVRRGVGYGQMWERHHQRREGAAIARIILWAAIFPLSVFAAAPLTRGWSLLLLVIYPLRALRIAASYKYSGQSWRDGLIWGGHCVATGFPYLCGLIRHAYTRAAGKEARLIEYRKPPSASQTTP